MNCDLRFLQPNLRLEAIEEEARYRQHHNEFGDPAYAGFLKPLFDAVLPNLQPGARGLDFGAGSGPVLAQMFEHAGFPVALYDPYFWPDTACLNLTYDFIVTSEVVEHLYSPREEFARLFALLKPGGWLAVMTLLFNDQVDFEKWHYARDPTHVVFYSASTFAWLAQFYNYRNLTYTGERIVLLQRPFMINQDN